MGKASYSPNNEAILSPTGLTMEEQKKQDILGKERIFRYGLAAIMIVLVYEVFKASHHGLHISLGHDIDWEATGFWFLDAIVGAIVTFALIWVAFSFERIEGVMRVQENTAGTLSNDFKETSSKLERLQRDFVSTKIEMQTVARSIAAEGGMIEKLKSPELWNTLNQYPELQACFLENLNELTGIWSNLIVAEGNNQHSKIKDENLGLICWGVAIDTYLKEEIDDIRSRTVATNVGVYIKLIEALVDRILKYCEGNDFKVELFATSVLLPVEYYNWKEYKKNSDADSYVRLSGTSLAFMDSYREKMKNWLREPEKLKLKRVLLLQDIQQMDDEYRILIHDLALPTLSQLRHQSKLTVLCDTKEGKANGEPRLFKIGEIDRFIELEPGFPELHREEYAYAIGSNLIGRAQYKSEQLEERILFDVFERQLHTTEPNPQVYCLVFNNDESAARLKYLPELLGGSDGTKRIKCPDFLTINVTNGETSKIIVCVATRMKPNYDTMSLRLITEENELALIEEFIKFANQEAKQLKEVID